MNDISEFYEDNLRWPFAVVSSHIYINQFYTRVFAGSPTHKCVEFLAFRIVKAYE